MFDKAHLRRLHGTEHVMRVRCRDTSNDINPKFDPLQSALADLGGPVSLVPINGAKTEDGAQVLEGLML